MADYFASIFGTEKDKVNCSFYLKIGACRHGDRCSRVHNKPSFSNTVLLQNLYVNPKNHAKSQGDGKDISDEEDQRHFDEFFEDIYVELSEKYGPIREMNVCDNLGDHLIGNVYVKFKYQEDADKAVEDLNQRWFGGKPVYAELSTVTDFKEAGCRQYEIDTCTRGGFCNFMHLKQISKKLKRDLLILSRHRSHRSRSRSDSRSLDRSSLSDRDSGPRFSPYRSRSRSISPVDRKSRREHSSKYDYPSSRSRHRRSPPPPSSSSSRRRDRKHRRRSRSHRHDDSSSNRDRDSRRSRSRSRSISASRLARTSTEIDTSLPPPPPSSSETLEPTSADPKRLLAEQKHVTNVPEDDDDIDFTVPSPPSVPVPLDYDVDSGSRLSESPPLPPFPPPPPTPPTPQYLRRSRSRSRSQSPTSKYVKSSSSSSRTSHGSSKRYL